MTTQSTLTQTSPDRKRFGLLQKIQLRSDRTILIVIVILAVCLRLASAIAQGNLVGDLPGVFDQISYHGLAQRVVDGFGFSFAQDHWPATRGGEPTAHWSYLYTLYLAAIYKLFGIYPVVARVIQALVSGIFQILLSWRIARRIFGERAGLIAAAISAVYIYFFYYAGALITESFYIVCILWTFDVAFRITHSTPESKHERAWFMWMELGLAIGLTVLLRQVFLLFLPFLFIWIWWNRRTAENSRWKQVLRWSAVWGLAVAGIVLILMVVPFTIRNYRAFGTFVLLNTNAGFAFYWGNHPIHGTHFMPLLPPTGPSYYDLIPEELRSLNEGLLDKALLQEGIQIVLDDPGRYLILSFSRIEEYIKFWPSPNSGLVSNLSRVASFGILLPFIIYGVSIAIGKFRKPSYPGQAADILILFTFVIIYAAIHLLTWTLIRYRLPIDSLLILFAAVGMENLVNKLRLRFNNRLLTHG